MSPGCTAILSTSTATSISGSRRSIQRFEAIDRRFQAVDHRFELVDQRFAALEQHLDTRLEAVEHRIVATIRGEMATLVTTQTRVIVLGLVGALTANTGLVLAASRLG